MNFFEHQSRAKQQSRWLIGAFLVAAGAVILAVDFIVLLFLGASPSSSGLGEMTQGWLDPNFINSNLDSLALSSAATGGVSGLSSLYKVASLRAGGSKVATSLGGTLVDADTRDPLCRRFRNVVEEIAIASGVPVPDIYVLEQESGINAFAAGYSTSDAAIAVTRGTLEKLSRAELQGVVAHEFSHIFNGDMRINIRLLGLLFGILLVSIIGRQIMHSARFMGGSRRKEGGGIIVVGMMLMVVGYAGLFFARWIKAALSRQREYLADASAVQFTRDPDGIAGALKKIGAYSNGSYLEAESEEVSHMLFGSGTQALMFSTHPPLAKRISRIDPQFKVSDIAELATQLADSERRERELAIKEMEAQELENQKSSGDGFAPGVFNPAELADAIGNPKLDALLAAATVAASIPPVLERAAHSIAWAPEVLMLSLLDIEPKIREKQLLIIAEELGTDIERRVNHLLATTQPLQRAQRMPLYEITFPALKRRSRDELERISNTVRQMVLADGEVEVFEYFLAKMFRLHLADAMSPSQARSSGSLKLASVASEVHIVMSVLAGQAGEKDRTERVFFDALKTLGIESKPIASIDSNWASKLDQGLDRLDQLNPKAKQKLVAELGNIAMADNSANIDERELLRVICASIHAPLPTFMRRQ
ncbi:MAG TPA: peptidase M48 [Gammaproteobacteria bacterium]|nr:peptidase M48 [Gammaproteobacteria bacterium]